jgi:hypothetical protein
MNSLKGKMWWLGLVVILARGRDLGCILFLAEALIKQAQEECGNQPCPRPMSFPRPLLTERLDRRGGR